MYWKGCLKIAQDEARKMTWEKSYSINSAKNK